MDNISKLITREWPYWFGGVVLGILNVAFLFITAEPLGITTTMSLWGGALLEIMGVTPGDWDYFNFYRDGSFLKYTFFSEGTWMNIGITMGAMLGALMSSQFRIRAVKSGRYVFAALLGGFLMGYGARLAPRCNIGSLLGAIPSLSIQGWVFALFVFAGAFIGTKLVVKYFID